MPREPKRMDIDFIIIAMQMRRRFVVHGLDGVQPCGEMVDMWPVVGVCDMDIAKVGSSPPWVFVEASSFPVETS